jgi:hypothetical protein
MSDSSSDDELLDIRAMGKKPSGPPKPPGQCARQVIIIIEHLLPLNAII